MAGARPATATAAASAMAPVPASVPVSLLVRVPEGGLVKAVLVSRCGEAHWATHAGGLNTPHTDV
ncbi:hypothetical protein GCM10023347_13700 [Streptomyces chumphonensis]